MKRLMDDATMTLERATEKLAAGFTFEIEDGMLTNQPIDKRAPKPDTFQYMLIGRMTHATVRRPRQTRRTVIITVEGKSRAWATRRLGQFIEMSGVTLVANGATRD